MKYKCCKFAGQTENFISAGLPHFIGDPKDLPHLKLEASFNK